MLPLCIVCLTFLITSSSVSGLVCLNCPDIAHPRFCEHVEECSLGEVCGLERRLDAFGDVAYKLGCTTSQVCSASSTNKTINCQECCISNICNTHGCGEPDDKFSNVSVCYHCDGNLPTENCQKIGFCKANELCYTKEEYRSGEQYIQTGCMEKQVCDLATGSQPAFGKRNFKRADPKVRCCSGNLCNNKNNSIASHLSTQGLIISTTTTGPDMTTPIPTLSNCNSTPVDSAINCNFESSSICGFTQGKHDNFDWLRHSGGTPSFKTGPTADHTYKTSQGHYMYIEASIVTKAGEYARLWTPQITPAKGQCLSFWYNMYGLSIGTLNIYTAVNSTVNLQSSNLIGSVTGDQGQSWHQKCIPLTGSEPIIVGFEGIATKGYTGDIAIDDIQLNMDCPCVCNAQNSGETPSTTRTTNMVDMATTVITNAPTTSTITPVETTTVAPTKTSGTTATTQPPVPTTPTIVASPINCDFESSDVCSYMQEKNETHDWFRNAGMTNSLNTGPTADHTYNTAKGHYMYLETSNALQMGEKARLWSPSFTPTTGQCLSFWYNMYGRTVGSLLVYTANNSTGTPVLGKPVCGISGNQGHPWHQKCVSLPDSQPISVVFEGVTGDGYTGDIALDDVQLNFKCPCKDICTYKN